MNLNTIVSNTACADPQLDQAVWRAVLGQDADIAWNPFAATAPATSVRDMLTLKQGTTMFRDAAATSGGGNTNGNAAWKKNREYDFNPALTYATAVRLANVATIRSNVFAVWITLQIEDSSSNATPPRIHRMFAIVDRSIPVASQPGRTLNVRESIRLQRFLE